MAKTTSPEEKLQILERMSVDELRDAIIQTLRRQGRAEVDLQYYKDSYKEVIKEEVTTRVALMARLETLMEADRIRAARENWLSREQIKKQIDDIRANNEEEPAERKEGGGFLRPVDDLPADGGEGS